MVSLARVQDELSKLSYNLRQLPNSNINSSQLCCYSVESRSFILKEQIYLLDLFVKFFSPNKHSTWTLDTVGYFQKIFGEKRVQRIFPKSKDIEFLTSQDGLLKEQVIEILEHIGELYLEDYQELIDEVNGYSQKIRFFDENETADIRSIFKQREIFKVEDCSYDVLQELSNILIPIKSIKSLFLDKLPEIYELVSYVTSGRYLLHARVIAYEKLRLQRERLTEKVWTMHLAKVLAMLEMPKRVVLQGPNRSYYTIHEIVQGQGAFKYFIKPLGSNERESYILYRGTSILPCASQRFSSVHDDLRPKLGSGGAEDTATKTNELLLNPNLGFVRDSSEKVGGIGLSLGGAHLMRDAVRLYGKFSKITTVVSPGIDTKCAVEFRDRCSSKPEDSPLVRHFIEADDFLDQFGSKLLGWNCRPEDVRVEISIFEESSPGDNNETLQEGIKRIVDNRKKIEYSLSGISDRIRYINRALLTAHIRNTVDMPHKVLELTNYTNDSIVQSILDHSLLAIPQLEKIRKIIGSMFEEIYSRL